MRTTFILLTSLAMAIAVSAFADGRVGLGVACTAAGLVALFGVGAAQRARG